MKDQLICYMSDLQTTEDIFSDAHLVRAIVKGGYEENSITLDCGRKI